MIKELLVYNPFDSKKKYDLNYFFFFIIILFPISFIIGPALFELICLLILFFSIKHYKYQKEYFSINKKIEFIFLFLFSYLIFLSLISIDPPLSLKNTIFLFRIYFFIIFMSLLLSNNKFFYTFIFLFFIISIFLSLDGMVEFFFGKNVFGYQQKFSGRLSSIFGDELILGGFLARIFSISILFFLFTKNNFIKNNLFISIYILISITTIFLSGERTPFLILILNLILLLLIDSFRKIIIIILILFPILISLISLFNQSAFDRMILHTAKQVSFSQFKFYPKEYLAHYAVAYNMFLEKPLLGHGVKTFRIVCAKPQYKKLNGCSTHPHNYFLQIISETGLIGLFIYIGIFFILIKTFIIKNISKVNNNNETKAIIILSFSFIINFIPFLTSSNLFNNFQMFLLSIPLMLMIPLKKKIETNLKF